MIGSRGSLPAGWDYGTSPVRISASFLSNARHNIFLMSNSAVTVSRKKFYEMWWVYSASPLSIFLEVLKLYHQESYFWASSTFYVVGDLNNLGKISALLRP